MPWIWFQLLFGIGSRRAELLLGYFDSPQEILDGIQVNNRVLGMLEPKELAASEAKLAEARDLYSRTVRKGCQVVTPDHPDYPPLLRALPDRPAALYAKGDLGCLRDTLAVAMVGTRHRTEYGKQVAIHLAGGLARAGATVVSGLAAGIDTDCHQAALEAGGRTVGFLGCGIDVDYPKGSSELKRAMCEGGAVVTEFPLGVQPYPANFPLRNRLVSGVAHGTVVVEADLRSGSLITACLALEQGRELFAVPGSIFAQGVQGTHQLLKNGAYLVEDAEDILKQYSQSFKLANPRKSTGGTRAMSPLPGDEPTGGAAKSAGNTAPRTKRTLPDGLTDEAADVYDRFGPETITVDALVSLTGLPTGDVLSHLTELEIYGMIQSYPGRRFGLT